MTGLLGTAALLCAASAALCGALAAASTGSLRTGLAVLLDLLLAAGLLRLAAAPGPGSLAVTALVVLVRRLAGRGVRAAAVARHGPPG